ncbi:MAG: tetratricopeptide repeat protein [Bradyrhizobium sp.]|uniref:tetratricopeptide repeat-containing glycosyltransferase family protein n=1 Tax=Bradyrhizobium sp. TaxID=376 RepID=UPI001C28278D|nr:tetratricopeptide repeat protein [Bradyrhizobium sp.]MBU6461899.1 tetratricopeptide repeat protein [Pseudomonadota bacterium]MDE2068654.1 tetratricopeptide repeat protein [Bradyrhizobium sp.]MDE2243390.1 tetratricopeptide repeat protein [Bradyrhizobium sp.]MDE2471716.1 tetratricopeptide repeat protein [Bradyrhizobium sp.]
MSRRERRAAGQKSRTKPAIAEAYTPAALFQSATSHRQAGRPLDAQLCCQQALSIDPVHADSMHLLGQLSFDAGQYDHALEWFTRVIRQDPRPEFLSSLGHTLQRQGRHDDALKAFDKAVQLRPDNADLWKDLGVGLAELKRMDEALLTFQHALKLAPDQWDKAYRCGFVLREMERPEEALSYFDLADRLQPDQPAVLELRGVVLHSLKRYEEALAENLRAYGHNPNNAATCNNIGAALQFLRRDEEALPWFERAIALRPDFVVAMLNKAGSQLQTHRRREAEATYRQVQALDPGNAEPDWNLSLLYMLQGNFEAGWAMREARWRKSNIGFYPKFSEPRWFGNADIAGRTIVICADEGLGDTIQFVRYVPMVAALGARVILVVDPPAHALLSGMPGIAHCLRKDIGVSLPFDLHCPMSGLPLAFSTRLDTIPPGEAYLPPLPEHRIEAWRSRLGAHDKLRVGLVWSGNPIHSNDHNRSTSLQTFARVLDLDATFLTLQKDPRPEDRVTLQEQTGIVDLTADLTDFVETAALLSCLDVIVTVDTSVAHLSAALGRPTWILLPYDPDYRWLLDRDDSPWYPTVRLFRQDKTRDYATVLDRVRGELQALISAKCQPETNR